MAESDTARDMYVQKIALQIYFTYREWDLPNKNFYPRRSYIAVGYQLSRLSKNYILTM